MKILLVTFFICFNLQAFSGDSRSAKKKACDENLTCQMAMSGVFGNEDDRVQVQAADYNNHFKAIGKIERIRHISETSKATNHCTGTLIDGFGQFDKKSHPNKYVLTAGHCVYEPEYADIAKGRSLVFIPSYGIEKASYSRYRVEKVLIDADYLKSRIDFKESLLQNDWALLKLEREVSEVPKRERAFLKPAKSDVALPVVNLGYPGYYNFDWVKSTMLFKHYGISLISPNLKLMSMTNEVSSGQSGGPIVERAALENKMNPKTGERPYPSSKVQIVGINVASSSFDNRVTNQKDPEFNSGVTINENIVRKIKNWILKEEGKL